jgi:hypothetical protein
MDFGFLPHNLRVALFVAVIREFQRPTAALRIDEDFLKWLFEKSFHMVSNRILVKLIRQMR